MKVPSGNESAAKQRILGLDIGANSIGWALIETRDGQPAALKACGARAFDAGVEGDLQTGTETSRAAARREKRLRRRLLFRRRRRLDKLARTLQRAGLLPPGDLQPAEQALRYWRALDRDLFPERLRCDDSHLAPYALRARALDHPLTPYEIGRALYHLAQRRGFLSNRRVRLGKRGAEQEKEEGKVKEQISSLAEAMRQARARTVGEYLACLDPEQERVRSRYLGRQMLQEEFERIWSAQAPHHPDLLTDQLKQQVHRAIFFQRPLKSARKLIGGCELEAGRPRAPMCSLAAQRFRCLQKLNDLRIIQPDGDRVPLSDEQRAALAGELGTRPQLSFSQAAKLLRLPRGHKLNFETEGEKGIPGSRTASQLAAIFGAQRWNNMTEAEREHVIIEMRSIHSRDALKRRSMKLWGLDEASAEALANLPLEDGYCNLSRCALGKLLPLMEQGIPYATARQQVYGDQPPPRSLPLLPPLERALEIRNPAVTRALTELRAVVNDILRTYGKPDLVRIELARDLKRPRKEREAIAKAMAANRRAREDAARNVIEKAGIPQPRPSDIEKWLLAEECRWTCPYTGRHISVADLFGDHPQFDIEHIIPLHRSLDDSFANKTLCFAPENRTRKHNRTPWEAYHGTQQWDDILNRVRQFAGRFAKVKLNLFTTPPDQLPSLDDFSAQQLADTRYASRLAAKYLGLLYGAGETGVAPDGRRVIQVTRGQVTGFLRDQWQLNFMGGGRKVRDDHRQHAIDAIVIALTTPAVIKRLSDAAAHALEARRRRFAPMDPPWPAFLHDVQHALEQMVVSHRVSRKVSGALHEETIYSPPKPHPEGGHWAHRRKPLAALAPHDIAKIVDPTVRACVQAKLEELGETNPAKAFKDEQTHPMLQTRKGRLIPIHKVRLRERIQVDPIGAGARLRHVKLGSNHHVEIVEAKDKRGNLRWEGVVVTMLEAARRLRRGEPVVRRDHGPDKEFRFSLAASEIIRLDAEDTQRDALRDPGASPHGLYVVKKITKRGEGEAERVTVGIVSLNDARPSTAAEARSVRELKELSPEALRKRSCRKVLVTPLGQVRWAND